MAYSPSRALWGSSIVLILHIYIFIAILKIHASIPLFFVSKSCNSSSRAWIGWLKQGSRYSYGKRPGEEGGGGSFIVMANRLRLHLLLQAPVSRLLILLYNMPPVLTVRVTYSIPYGIIWTVCPTMPASMLPYLYYNTCSISSRLSGSWNRVYAQSQSLHGRMGTTLLKGACYFCSYPAH